MSDKENDHNTSDRKEKTLRRHELCCLRFSDGTASDRDASALKRKGIDPQPWVELQKLIRNHFVGVKSPDLADSICKQLGIQTISIGDAIGLSNEVLSDFSVMDVVSKRLELDFDAKDTFFSREIFTDEPTHQEILISDEIEPVSTDIKDPPVELPINQLEPSVDQWTDLDELVPNTQNTEKTDTSNADVLDDDIPLEEVFDDSKSESITLPEVITQPSIEFSDAFQVDDSLDIESEVDEPKNRFTVEDISEEMISVTPSSDVEKRFFDEYQEQTKQVTTDTDEAQTVPYTEEKMELSHDEITELAKLEGDFSFGLYLIDERQNPDLSSLIMSQVIEEHRSLVGSYDLEEDSLEQLIEDTYKSMTNPPPRTPVSQEPIKPLFDDILQDINNGVDLETTDVEIHIDDVSSDKEKIIDIAGYRNTFASDQATQGMDENDNHSDITLASQTLEDDSDEDYDSEESEEFMLSLDSAIQIEAIEEREIRDLEAIFEGSRIDVATALRDPNPPSNSEMIRVIMEQVNRVGSIQHQLKLVTEDVDENDNENASLSYDDDFIGDVVVSITDIRPPVTVDINSTSGNKTMLALSGLIAIAAALLLYFFASVPTGNETPVVGGFELAETDVEILDIDSDEDFSIMKRDGEPTIIFIHEE